ncbi:pyridoxamine 5'-phosphate oxidase [Spirillospora sp. CA-294931]|uniref:pyridoxamine 5'-phosphate oxidase n=1 Tax=Spirillospora sp. CA-294931 TaxID=3240042 RepID=UPI003D89C143
MEQPAPDPARLRRSYEVGSLTESGLPADPLALFTGWFADAAASELLPEPNAMILATASDRAVPSARTVLLKGYGPPGFRFFTNLTSRKGQDLAANPRAALVFPWHPVHRQVIVSGPVVPLTREESAAYFGTRPYGSRLGAWASEHQSAVIDGREELEARYAELAERWPDHPGDGHAVPLPEFWGGFRVVPETIEFWQGRPDRLHDRLRYVRPVSPEGEPDVDAGWTVDRLSP